MRFLKRIFGRFTDWFLYTLLSEKQKESLANMFSEKQKDRIKKFTSYGRMRAERLKVKQYKDHLYSLGFVEPVLTEMTREYYKGKSVYLKRLLAWELTLWYTNENTEKGAEKALSFIDDAVLTKQDREQLRRIAIIKAECLQRLNETDKAYQVLKDEITRAEHPDVYLALVNLESNYENKLEWINKALKYYDFDLINIKRTTEEPSYDQLRTETTKKRNYNGPKVSVILPAFNSEVGIKVAIESILDQTWQDIELIIVDDCSTDETLKVIQTYAETDERIRVFQTPVNSGPYVARNIGLQNAIGEFVTINDADDWSHTWKLETQINHLINNSTVIANTSEQARMTENFNIYRRGMRGKYIFPNMSSLMFRRKIVLDKIGYWDRVRFAADGEFKRRLMVVFGENAVVDLQSGPLSFQRQSVTSLTASSKFGYHGFFMGVRKEYAESFSELHRETKMPYFDFEPRKRLFPAPNPMLPQRKKGIRDVDIVIATDFRTINGNNTTAIREITKWREKNKIVGLIQLYKYDVDLDINVSTNIRQFIDGTNVQMLVYGEEITTPHLILFQHQVCEYKQKYIPHVIAENVHVVVDSSITEVQHKNIKDHFKIEPIYYPIHDKLQAKLKESSRDMHIANQEWKNV